MHLAGQRFQTYFLRLLTKLKNWEKLRSKAQKKAQNVSTFTFFGALTCPSDVKLAGHGFLTSGLVPLKLNELKNCGWLCLKAQKKLKIRVCLFILFLSFHLSC